jgi:hypothetical protein
MPGGHFVIRGGYGLSNVPLNGQNRQPMPSFSSPATAFGVNSGQVNPSYAMRLSSNPPDDPPLSWSQVLSVPSNGLITLNSLNYSGTGFAISPNMKTPYSQNWNFTLAYQLDDKDVVEIAYAGNKGTHLFMPHENENASSLSLVNALYTNNISPTTTVPDPLGRTGSNGKVIAVQQGSLGSTYLGFTNLYTYWDSSGDSIYNSAYVSFIRRPTKGLTLSTSYTFGKSIDDASDASPENNTLTTPTTIGGGETNFGGSRSLDRSVSTFDVKHNFVLSALYDLPVGRGRAFFANMPRLANAALGGWTVSGIARVRSGTPFMPVLHDNNLLGDNSSSSEYSIRPDIVSGVPLVNPLYSSSCPITVTCQPYLNPAAFERPPLGELGDAPRTLDGARGPLQKYLDASVQKNFRIKERIRLQLRVDMLNAFNHPVLSVQSGYGGSDSFMSAPSTAVLSAASYNSWAAANNQPLSTTTQGAANLALVQSFVTNNQVNKVLPNNFFTVPLPLGFGTMSPNSFNILTPNGYKLYQLANAYNTSFGDLSVKNAARYVQFGIKIYF